MRASEQTQAQLACKLQEANNRFNEFLSIASHELKGPLTTLKGNLQLAQRTLHTLLPHRMQTRKEWSGALEKLQRYLERAEHQISMQNRLASDLIDVSRIRAGKFELQMQLCDLRQIVYEVVEDQRQAAEGRIIRLELPSEQAVVRGDTDRLEQVASNYLTNALKYSSFDKPVEVAVTTESSGVRVTVSDQGPGLTEDEQERVWERFYRAKGTFLLCHTPSIGLGAGRASYKKWGCPGVFSRWKDFTKS